MNPIVKKIHDWFLGNKIIGGLFRLEQENVRNYGLRHLKKQGKRTFSTRIIIGGGRMEETVNNWVKEATDDFIKLVGQVEDVGSWLSVMDIFLFTSVAEGLPNVLIEAQGFGFQLSPPMLEEFRNCYRRGDRKNVNDATGLSLGDWIIELLNREDLDDIFSFKKIGLREVFSYKHA